MAQFEPIAEAGHLPHIEQPERVLDPTREFAGETNRAIVA
jgi:pimeloyl-ACP methyl ester carboxylesterase